MIKEELLSFYSMHNIRPEIPSGIDFIAREAALTGLKQYYSPGSRSFGSGIDYDSFRGITPFLNSLEPDSSVEAAEIQHFFNDLPNHPEEQQFTTTVRGLRRWFTENKENLLTWASCPYRPDLFSICQTGLHLEDHLSGTKRKFVFGAVGSSGGHEFFNLSSQEEVALLEESLLEALVVRGAPVADIKKLPGKIKETAQQLLEERIHQSPFAWSPNCLDWTLMANQGVERIADVKELTPENNYQTCLMHKFNARFRPYWEANDLPTPGNFGRLRCPSHCAESQAILRTQFALHVPLLTGVKESYLLSIGESAIFPQDKPSVNTVELLYIVPTNGVYQTRRLVLDKTIALLPFTTGYPYYTYLDTLLRNRRIDLREYPMTAVYCDGKDIVVLADPEAEILQSDSTYAVNAKELIRVKWDGTPRLKSITIPAQNLWSSSLPCVHCLNTFERYGVEHLHIEQINVPAYKGDDGLALEYLMKTFPGKLSIGEVTR